MDRSRCGLESGEELTMLNTGDDKGDGSGVEKGVEDRNVQSGLSRNGIDPNQPTWAPKTCSTLPKPDWSLNVPLSPDQTVKCDFQKR